MSVTAQNHSFVIIHLWTFLLRCLLYGSQNYFSFQLVGFCLHAVTKKLVPVCPWVEDEMFSLEFIKSFWKPFMSLCPEQMLGKFFVSTCLNWSCYLTNSVHWKLVGWCQIDPKNGIKKILYIKKIYLSQKNVLLQIKISHKINQHFLSFTSCPTFTELSESWIFSNFSLILTLQDDLLLGTEVKRAFL